MDDPSQIFSAGVSEKQYILGGDGTSDKALLHLGRYLALDRSTGSDVRLDVQRPHAILVSGKRGYGKSYTMAVLVEEMLMLPSEIKMNLASVVIDTMGIFWTFARGNELQAGSLSDWELEPKGFNTNIYVPAGSEESYRKRNIRVRTLSMPLWQLDGYQWCEMFGLEAISSAGVLIVRVIEALRETSLCFSFEDVLDAITQDERSDTISRSAAENYFRTAMSWGVFAEDGRDICDIVTGGSLSVIDVSTIKSDSVRSVVVGFIAGDIYHKRLEARRAHERMLMGEKITEKGMPMVWMFIDEAHQFVPVKGNTLSSDVLLNEWLRQGRQPGLSLVLATQRPSSLHPDVLSQSDIVICHRLTSQDDILALESVRPTYMREHFGDSIRKMGIERGIALIVDDTTETTHVIRMRPRLSWHGGNEQLADSL
ncbi:ATP-binding protein [Methanolobus halotolerans]|uniref:Nucleotidyltransferase n=1 Tax=Methanolobus halotolerans TaxID=2052935 RepID=A0A4E0QD39_9EURY|nr:DUF87 domain-containing protein [Methanolobus halotolerans]TGC11157.1 nucleotidyltransferase [Methanolobus halotolerans]